MDEIQTFAIIDVSNIYYATNKIINDELLINDEFMENCKNYLNHELPYQFNKLKSNEYSNIIKYFPEHLIEKFNEININKFDKYIFIFNDKWYNEAETINVVKTLYNIYNINKPFIIYLVKYERPNETNMDQIQIFNDFHDQIDDLACFYFREFFIHKGINSVIVSDDHYTNIRKLTKSKFTIKECIGDFNNMNNLEFTNPYYGPIHQISKKIIIYSPIKNETIFCKDWIPTSTQYSAIKITGYISVINKNDILYFNKKQKTIKQGPYCFINPSIEMQECIFNYDRENEINEIFLKKSLKCNKTINKGVKNISNIKYRTIITKLNELKKIVDKKIELILEEIDKDTDEE